MKLIIDISDNLYNAIKYNKYRLYKGKLYDVIRDGTPLKQELMNNRVFFDRWISVSERFPTKEEYIVNNGLFIVSDGDRTYAAYFDVYIEKRFGEPTMYGFRVDRSVKAWLPLPKPYKSESEAME